MLLLGVLCYAVHRHAVLCCTIVFCNQESYCLLYFGIPFELEYVAGFLLYFVMLLYTGMFI